MAVVPRALTLAHFVELPEEEPPLEYIDGVVTRKMSPKLQHSALQGELIKRIDASGLPGKVARAFPELRTTFGGASHVPDIAVFRWDRIPRDSTGKVVNDVFVPPDIAVEIVSPGQSTSALVRRCLWYTAYGVQLALVVEPADESVLAIRPDSRVSAWHAKDPIDLAELLPGFELSVEQLFACLR